jgi:hypothetical protein
MACFVTNGSTVMDSSLARDATVQLEPVISFQATCRLLEQMFARDHMTMRRCVYRKESCCRDALQQSQVSTFMQAKVFSRSTDT